MYAFGGVPFKRPAEGGPVEFVGREVSEDLIRSLVVDGLGASAVLTYENRSDLPIGALGRKCLEKKHTWAYKWITISVLFVGYGPDVEKAFLRDSNFYESWTIGTNAGTFGMSGSISAFKKFASNAEDTSFDVDTRKAMGSILSSFEKIWQ